MDLYRGENYGVFTGPNGYYVARMTANKKNYYEAVSGGDGWSDGVRQRCNTPDGFPSDPPNGDR